jgi:hypothetical protein
MTLPPWSGRPPAGSARLGRLRHRPETLAVCPTLCRNPSLQCRLFATRSDQGDSEAAAERKRSSDDRRRTGSRTRERGQGGTPIVATLGRLGSRCLRLAFWARCDGGATARSADRAPGAGGPARPPAIRDPEGSDSGFLNAAGLEGRADPPRVPPAPDRPRNGHAAVLERPRRVRRPSTMPVQYRRPRGSALVPSREPSGQAHRQNRPWSASKPGQGIFAERSP